MRTKKIIPVCLLILALSSNSASCDDEWTANDRANEAEQVSLWRNKLGESVNMNNSGKIELLQQGLINIGYRKSMTGHSQDVDNLFLALQKSITSIPGYAEYYANQMREARAEIDKHGEKRPGTLYISEYDNCRVRAFEVLQHLPSVESVAVLGEYLADIEDLGPQITEGHVPDSFGPPANCDLAVEGLRNLIEGGPVKSQTRWIPPGERDAWRLWYAQIKSGNRTFRFKGDPTEYDLNGPAPKQKLERIERDRKREAERAAGHGKKSSAAVSETPPEAAKASKPLSIAGIFAACALVGAAVWHFVRSRKRRIS